MVIYCDGGAQRQSHNRHILSWGIRVEGEEVAEIRGHIEVGFGHHHCHETVAFIEAVLFCRARGYTPNEATFVTDDETLVYGAFGSDCGWEFGKRHETLERQLELAAGLYSVDTVNVAREYIKGSRFIKVKGHKSTVNNLRVDYLAAQARKECLGTAEPFLNFEEWIAGGFVQYTRESSNIWYPAFATM